MTVDEAIRPLGLDHVVLRVADIEAAIGFYRDVLGFEVERRLDELGLVQLRVGQSLIDLVELDSPLGRAHLEASAANATSEPESRFAARNMDHFAIALSEFDEAAIRAQLSQHGIDADETRRLYGAGGFGPSIYLRDPDGNTVELKGPGERVSRIDPGENPES
jgi:catechol 2,3-dioxygenase-like lactoylglutathione lyase family enzyme